MLLGMLVVCSALGQNYSILPQDLEKKVDKIFEREDLNSFPSPGVSFGILYKGKIVYKKSYGQSDIENNKVITSKTLFNLGQTSAYFTAFAIAKLIVENKLSLDEDVREHLDILKNYDHKITVRDLLGHSSGIYDFNILLQICGWNYYENISQQDVLKAISLQKEAAFKPGTDYAESDSNFVVLAELIAKISGQPYQEYMKEHVFSLAGMKQTVVRTSSTQFIEGMAKSYRKQEGKIFLNHSENDVLGINNIFSSVDDLIHWHKYLSNVNENTHKILKLIDRKVVLENGRTYSVSQGNLQLGQLYGHKERGAYSTYILGSAGGHDSSIFRFPDQDYVAVALSNNGNGYNGYYGVISAHRIMDKSFTEPETVDFDKIETKKLSREELKEHEGFYWDALGELSREIRVINDTLRYVRGGGNTTSLIALSTHKFQMKMEFDDKIYVTFSKGKSKKMFYEYEGAEPIPFEKYTPITVNNTMLAKSFKGTYVNREYQITFYAKPESGALILENVKTGKITYKPIKPELFLGNRWFMASIHFKRNSEGKVRGFHAKHNSIRNLYFEKID